MAKGTTVRMWRRTIFVLMVLIVLGFGSLVVSLFRLQIVEGEELQTRAVNQQTQDTTLTAKRGTIYDRNMKVLATSADVYKVVLDPNYVRKELEQGQERDGIQEEIAQGLGEILDMDPADILALLEKQTYYAVAKTKVETDVKDQILEFKTKLELGNAIQLQPDYKRYYPYGSFASAVLGFTNSENQGVTGVEASYNDYLSGVAGKLVTAKNAKGSDMPFQYEQRIEAQDGYSLVLTIDEVVQHFLEKSVEEAAADCGARNRACGIVMNVNTGEILAMTVKGDYDPNDPYTITDPADLAVINAIPDDEEHQEERSQAIRTAQEKQWRNKCISDTYNPGSVFKMLTASMGIEEGLVTESTQFYCGGSYQVADRNISCWKTAGHGTETFAQGLCNSCNPVFMQLSEMLGANTFYRYFEAFGMTQKTGIDLIGESNSIYYNAEGLGPTELATSSFGQSFRVTPIQMITAAAAVANGGYLVQPHVVSKVIDQEGNIVETIDTSVKRQVISEETSARVSAILQEAATTGSAKNGYVAGYRVAGKTGTSEKIDEWNAEGREGEKKYIASYCGYAPAEDPEIIMLVFFDEPLPQNGQVFGSAIAGPPFAETMAEILPYLGIEPKYTEEELSKLDISTPGVVGLTKEDAQVKISNASLTYKVYGEGEKVVSQIPEQGKSIPKGGTVVLYTDEASTSQTVAVPQLTGLSLSQVNSRAAEAGLNISVSGAALASGNAVSESQDIAEGTQVPPGTVVTVNFVDLEDVH
ncbi:MAG TPA: PASTA domain-containing protein [Candidatus Caccousia avistercoris]|nr:PASTA domain-containing protein [Candidatus Caccousia avistercoris]